MPRRKPQCRLFVMPRPTDARRQEQEEHLEKMLGFLKNFAECQMDLASKVIQYASFTRDALIEMRVLNAPETAKGAAAGTPQTPSVQNPAGPLANPAYTRTTAHRPEVGA